MALPTLEVLDDNKLNESDGDVVENTEEAALDEFIRQETELTAYSIKANAGSIHSPSHPCWAELRALRQGATQSSEASSLTHGGRGALNGRLRPQKKEQDPEEAALAKLRDRRVFVLFEFLADYCDLSDQRTPSAEAAAEIAFDYVSKRGHGMLEEYQMGYTSYHGEDGKCPKKGPNGRFPGAVATIDGYSVCPTNDYACLMNAVAKVGPVGVAVALSLIHI